LADFASEISEKAKIAVCHILMFASHQANLSFQALQSFFPVRISGFGFFSAFGLRVSDFVLRRSDRGDEDVPSPFPLQIFSLSFRRAILLSFAR